MSEGVSLLLTPREGRSLLVHMQASGSAPLSLVTWLLSWPSQQEAGGDCPILTCQQMGGHAYVRHSVLLSPAPSSPC